VNSSIDETAKSRMILDSIGENEDTTHKPAECSRGVFRCACGKGYSSSRDLTRHIQSRGSKSSSNAQSGPPLMPLSIRGY